MQQCYDERLGLVNVRRFFKINSTRVGDIVCFLMIWTLEGGIWRDGGARILQKKMGVTVGK
jgi:hypothetical protein